MRERNHSSGSEEETLELGCAVGRRLRRGDVVCLYGDLGAGKTVFVKGLARGMGIRKEQVKSPTFVLMRIYAGRLPVYHFDLYRLEEGAETVLLGYEEFMYGDGVAVVEWADRLGGLLPEERLDVTFRHTGEQSREIRFRAVGRAYEPFVRGDIRSIFEPGRGRRRKGPSLSQ